MFLGPCPPMTAAPFTPGQPWLTLVSGVSVNTGGLQRVIHPRAIWIRGRCRSNVGITIKGKRVWSSQLSWRSNSVFPNSLVYLPLVDVNKSHSEYCLFENAQLFIDFQLASIISHISPSFILSVLYQQVSLLDFKVCFSLHASFVSAHKLNTQGCLLLCSK